MSKSCSEVKDTLYIPFRVVILITCVQNTDFQKKIGTKIFFSNFFKKKILSHIPTYGHPPIGHQLSEYEIFFFFTFGKYGYFRPSIPIFRLYRHRKPKNPQGGLRSLTLSMPHPLDQKMKNFPDPPLTSQNFPLSPHCDLTP